MRQRLLILLGAAATASISLAAVQTQGEGRLGTEQAVLAGRLAAADSWTMRRRCLDEILKIPPRDRLTVTIIAVAAELMRVEDRLAAGRPVDESEDAAGEMGWMYYGDLIEIAAASDVPAVIPPLVRALDVGHPAIDALARFGNQAAGPLIAAVEMRTDAGFLVSGLAGLDLLIVHTPDLATSYRARIAGIARRHLKGRQHSAIVRRAIALCGLLQDGAAKGQLEDIANAQSPEAAGLEILGGGDFMALRRLAATVLVNMKNMRLE